MVKGMGRKKEVYLRLKIKFEICFNQIPYLSSLRGEKEASSLFSVYLIFD